MSRWKGRNGLRDFEVRRCPTADSRCRLESATKWCLFFPRVLKATSDQSLCRAGTSWKFLVPRFEGMKSGQKELFPMCAPVEPTGALFLGGFPRPQKGPRGCFRAHYVAGPVLVSGVPGLDFPPGSFPGD